MTIFKMKILLDKKKMLMNELHNWSNYDEDSNAEY